MLVVVLLMLGSQGDQRKNTRFKVKKEEITFASGTFHAAHLKRDQAPMKVLVLGVYYLRVSH